MENNFNLKASYYNLQQQLCWN